MSSVSFERRSPTGRRAYAFFKNLQLALFVTAQTYKFHLTFGADQSSAMRARLLIADEFGSPRWGCPRALSAHLLTPMPILSAYEIFRSTASSSIGGRSVP